jgi:hypothetical protein
MGFGLPLDIEDFEQLIVAIHRLRRAKYSLHGLVAAGKQRGVAQDGGFSHCFPPARCDAENLDQSLGRSLPRRETQHLTDATSYFLSAIQTLHKLYRIKNKQGSFPGRTPVAGVTTPSTICEFYLQPVCRAASISFSAHFRGRYFERPSFFLAYASEHLSMP